MHKFALVHIPGETTFIALISFQQAAGGPGWEPLRLQELEFEPRTPVRAWSLRMGPRVLLGDPRGSQLVSH